jgi:hypothetical protein
MNRALTRLRFSKAALAVRVWFWIAAVQVLLRRHTLPEAVERLATFSRTRPGLTPAQMSRRVARVLEIGPFRPRCLIRSLVLFRLLRGHDHAADLVIGLPSRPTGKDAHAWVELDGADLGPPPGKGTHVELARYP